MFLIEKLFQSFNLSSVTKAKVHNTLKQPTMNNGEEDDIYLLASRGADILQIQINQSSSEQQNYKVMASLKLPSFVLRLDRIPQQQDNQITQVVILCENLQILVVTFYNELENDQLMLKDNQIHAIQLQCHVNWNQYIDLQVTHNFIFVQHSNTQFTIIPYIIIDGNPEFQLNFTSYTKNFNPFQIIPYNLEANENLANFFPVLLFYSNEQDQIKVSQTLAISNAPIQLNTVQALLTIGKCKFWRAYVVKLGVVMHIDNKLIIIMHGDDRQIELVKDLICTPRQILELNQNEFLFQNGYQREIFLVNLAEIKVTKLGVFSYAEKMELIYPGVVFICSIIDDSQILYLNSNKIEKVAHLQNLGKIIHLSKDSNNTQITSFMSRYSAQGLSRQVKMTALKEQKQFSQPISLSKGFEPQEISNFKILKVKNSKSYTIALTEDNDLLVILHGEVIKKYQYDLSISDFDVKENKIFISFWFSSTISIVDFSGLLKTDKIQLDDQGLYNISTMEDSNIITNQTTVKGLISFEQTLFIAYLEDQLYILHLDNSNTIIKQDSYSFKSSFIKLVECSMHIIVIYSDKVIVFLKASLQNRQPIYFQINKPRVYDASISESEKGYYLSTVSMNNNIPSSGIEIEEIEKEILNQDYCLEEFQYQESIGSQAQATLQDELSSNIEYQEKSGNLTFIIKNQIIHDLNNQTYAISRFQQSLYQLKDIQNQQRQSILLICQNQPQYWQHTLLQTHTLSKSETNVFKILTNFQHVTVFLAGKHFDKTKGGFLKVMFFSHSGVFIDEACWLLSERVLDLGIQCVDQIWLLSEQKAILVGYQNEEGKFNQNLLVLQTVIDNQTIPSHIEVRDNEFLLYDDLKSMSLYTYDSENEKVDKQLSQMFDGLNWKIKFIGDYFIRISFDRTIQIYQKQQLKNYQCLKKIGFGDLHEDISSIHINDAESTFLFGTKQGSVLQGILLKRDQIVAIMEVQDQIKKLKKQKEIQKSKIEEEKAILQELKIVKQVSLPNQFEFQEPMLHKNQSLQGKGDSRNNQQNDSLLYLKKLFNKKLDSIENCFFTYQDLQSITKEKEFEEVFEMKSVQSFDSEEDFQKFIQRLRILNE